MLIQCFKWLSEHQAELIASLAAFVAATHSLALAIRKLVPMLRWLASKTKTKLDDGAVHWAERIADALDGVESKLPRVSMVSKRPPAETKP